MEDFKLEYFRHFNDFFYLKKDKNAATRRDVYDINAVKELYVSKKGLLIFLDVDDSDNEVSYDTRSCIF